MAITQSGNGQEPLLIYDHVIKKVLAYSILFIRPADSEHHDHPIEIQY